MSDRSSDATPEGIALTNAYDAGATRVPAWMAAVAAVAAVRPESIGAMIDWLVANRADLEASYESGRAARLATAVVPPEMRYEPELGALERSHEDHTLRERWLFADCLKRGFLANAIYAISGIEIAGRDVEMLDAVATVTLVVDRRAWPMAVTRRVAARQNDGEGAAVAGIAMMASPILGGVSLGEAMRFLQKALVAEAEGRRAEDLVADVLARKERIMGFGRPAVGADERVPVLRRVLREHGRDALPGVSILPRIEAAMFEQKALRATSAIWIGAILLDFGMTPEQGAAIVHHWLTANVYAQAVYSAERGLLDRR